MRFGATSSVRDDDNDEDRTHADALARRVVSKRRALGLGRAAAASKIGVSPYTLSKLERDVRLPVGDDLRRVADWAGADLVSSGEPAAAPSGQPEAFELHLRADRDLSDDDAQLLVDLMRTAAERLRKRERR